MRPDENIAIVDFPAALPQVTDQFFTGIELCPGRLIAIKIAYQANAESDVVEIIAVNMSAVYLTAPSIAHFNLAITGGCAVADDKVISKPVLHPANSTMVIIKYPRVPLPRAAVVHHDEFPAVTRHRRAPNFFDH